MKEQKIVNERKIILKRGETLMVFHEGSTYETLVNLSDASRQLGMSRNTLYNRMALGKIPYVVKSMSKKIRQSVIDEILENENNGRK